MNNYKNFEVKDWLDDPDFRKWVYRGEREAFWLSVLENTPAQAENMEQAREILLTVRGDVDDISDAELASRKANLLGYIGQESQKNLWWRRSWLQAAAVLLLMLGFGGYYLKRHSETPYNAVLMQSDRSKIIEVINQDEAVKLVTLPDGSAVILKKAAKISYPATFATDKREVVMVGEAFFEVQKNPDQPFFIYAGEMLTRVTGTSFSIKANAVEKQVQLVVKTGVVEIAMLNKAEARHITLNPNQLATLDPEKAELSQKNVATPVLIGLPIESQYFTFKKTPVKDVFLALEQAYGVHINFDRQVTSNCNITAKLGDEPIREKLQMICEVIDAKFEMHQGAISIFSNGCDTTH